MELKVVLHQFSIDLSQSINVLSRGGIKKYVVEIDAEAETFLYGSNSLTVCEIWMGFQIANALKLHSF